MKILVTGGAGFIGSALIRYIMSNTDYQVLNFDKLTYASNLDSLNAIDKNKNYSFYKGDICNPMDINRCFEEFKPNVLMHLAAESHVDRSISGPDAFIQSNIIGTYNLLEASRRYITKYPNNNFKFHHISTDEVYGDLDNSNDLFHENTPYAPSSPYSASKASSDHLVRAWHRTFNLPVLITNCSNNYGPYQNSEKLIPNVISRAISGKPIPIYGSGLQIRDWLFVDDHASALLKVATESSIGKTYNIGGGNEKTNIEVVEKIISIIESFDFNIKHKTSLSELIEFVDDRPGHDKRYAIDASKIQEELDWKPRESFSSGIKKTVHWFINNESFMNKILK